MTHFHRVFLGLGSNIGDSWQYLRIAVSSLPDVIKVSSVYETEPVEVLDKQDNYFNLVVELATELTPQQVLTVAQKVEQAADRQRSIYHGARTLDVDVLLYDDQQIHTANLTVPHPRMWDRRFVVEPLAEIAPDVVPDGWESSVTGEVTKAGTL